MCIKANALENAFAMYDGGRRGLPMYDVRFSMYDFDFSALCAEGAERMRTGCPGAMIRRGYKATVTAGGRRGLPMYDVRRTMYDCDVRARCAEGAERMRTGCPGAVGGETPPMYDGRGTMDDLNASARCAAASGVPRIPHAKKWVK